MHVKVEIVEADTLRPITSMLNISMRNVSRPKNVDAKHLDAGHVKAKCEWFEDASLHFLYQFQDLHDLWLCSSQPVSAAKDNPGHNEEIGY